MGRTITPTFRAELDVVHLATHKRETWTHCRWDGRPTAARLEEYADSLEASTLAGGCNEHLGVILVSAVRVIRQSTGEVAASYAPPMFRTVSA